jgi:hypothetical protein
LPPVVQGKRITSSSASQAVFFNSLGNYRTPSHALPATAPPGIAGAGFFIANRPALSIPGSRSQPETFGVGTTAMLLDDPNFFLSC